MDKREVLCEPPIKKEHVLYFWQQFPQKLFFLEFNLMYCDLWKQYIQVWKLFKGGNYLRAETIHGNTVYRLDSKTLATLCHWYI